jgi:hypothetical protein
MKKVALFLLIVAWCLAGNMVLAEDNSDEPQVTLSTQLSSSYIHSQSGYKTAKDPGLASEITFEPAFAKGAYVNVWNFTSLHNPNKDEFNYSVGWAGNIGPVQADVGFTYYDARKFLDPNWDYYSFYLEVDKKIKVNPKNELKPFVRAEAVFPVMKNSPQGGGNYFTAGLQHEIKLTEKLSYKHSVSVTYDTGTGGLNQAWVGGYDGKLAYKINKYLELNPIIVTARTPFNSPGDGRESVIAVAAGVTLYAF